ncbi:sigma 54-interacting transcriptional regulator [Desertibacillus haloalkaliphilus]|nr:sigma 54-interacting transcriptional regulator [Desertibacillus haloalkaliphilus]
MSFKELMSHNEYNQFIQSSFDGFVICDIDGTVLFQNPAAEKLTRLPATKVVGNNIRTLINEGTIDNAVTFKVLEQKKPVTMIQNILTGKNVLVSGVPVFDKAGAVKKVVCSIRDLTKIKQLEQERIDLENKNELVTQELEKLKAKQQSRNGIVAYDQSMKIVLERATKVAPVNSSVLILGESGVGKEGIVNFIHEHSNRREANLVKVNCGAIPEQLLESELFGYEAGSFTGASTNGKKGLFEASCGGTIFLDEIGEMPMSLQVKLLRVLQENEITRVGGTKATKVDIRVIAATNKDLLKLIDQGKFREDLYYRLNIIPIYVPSLRERKNDIIPLVYHFLNLIKNKYGVNRMFTKEALLAFEEYHWPGNVRELQNVIERVSLMSAQPIIEREEVRKEMRLEPLEKKETVTKEMFIQEQQLSLKDRIENYEKMIINELLKKYSSVRKTAKALRIDPSTLSRKIRRYKLKV